jgi:predicted O-methyltransferase YrrM
MKVYKLCNRLLHKCEAEALINCARYLPDDSLIVQIGASKGISTVAMLEARPDVFIFSIDIAHCPWEEESIIKAGLDCDRVVRVLGDSKKIHWPFPVDMLYIDGDHTYDGVKGDCEAWLGNVKPGGLVVFHDYVLKGAKPTNQVAQVVDWYFPNQKPFVRVDRIIGFEV